MNESKDNVKPIIRVTELYKSFGGNNVLNGVNLDVFAEESLVVIGGSGVGKSVLLKCIMGLVEYDKGTIEIEGKSVTDLTKSHQKVIRHQFGMLFQNSALFDSLSVLENIAFGPINSLGMSLSEANSVAMEKLTQLGLTADIAPMYPGELSSGMQKRVAFARTIATRPKIIFFDEPTTGLDPIMGSVVNDLILYSVRSLKATAVTITHDMNGAKEIGDRIAMLKNGRIIWVGSADHINQSRNQQVNNFIQGKIDE